MAGVILRNVSNVCGKTEVGEDVRLLLIDTCGDGAGVAVSLGERVVASESLPHGGGSAEIIGAIQRVVANAGCALAELNGVGVVSGPGSFTGVRVGMAAAKGLAEAAELRMITVSRMRVLAETAALVDGYVVLDAGRGEFYATEMKDGHAGPEQLVDLAFLQVEARGREVVVAEERVMARLSESAPEILLRLQPLRVSDALEPVLQMYCSKAQEMSLADATYVRRESDIYKPKANVGNV
jgi:tRNA threonylcarbamoyladenosine biosynthesis protein TsaB